MHWEISSMSFLPKLAKQAKKKRVFVQHSGFRFNTETRLCIEKENQNCY